MQRVLTALVLIAVVVLIIFKAPLWLVVLAAALVAELALYEYLQLANGSGAKVPIWLVMLCAALLFAATFALPTTLQMPVFGVLAVVLFTYAGFVSPPQRVLPDAAYSVFGLIYVAYPLTLLPLLSARENGIGLLLFLMAVVWSGDVVAMYTGRAFGKHKFAPTISPNKTWEGAAGSMAGSLLAGVAVIEISNTLAARNIGTVSFIEPLWQWIVIAAFLNIAAQTGDLLESALKRGADVKDSGSILPGHGGVLDRIDALLLAAPALWYALLVKDYFSQSRF